MDKMERIVFSLATIDNKRLTQLQIVRQQAEQRRISISEIVRECLRKEFAANNL